jgi:hypothetical protein
VSLQGIVLAVKAIQIDFYQPGYTEVMKFYTEPDIISPNPTKLAQREP